MPIDYRFISLIFLGILYSPVYALAQLGAVEGEWRAYGGDNGGTKYSPLDQIDKGNVKNLEIAWSWTTVDVNIHEANPDSRSLAAATYFECTPLMIGDVLYGTTSLGQAMAIDAFTGETLWTFDSESYKDGRPPNLGWISRGAAYWKDGGEERIFLNTGNSWLYALDIKTGKPIPSFGENGRADLTKGVRGAIHGRGYGHPSAPIVCRDVVIAGSSVSDGAAAMQGVPGRIKAFDARTGAEKWTFNIIPEEGEFGVETWLNDSWKYTGSANVWTSMAADDELGYVYLPTSTPNNDYYGGHRLGDNLFAESLVCLNVETGERVWHFQMVHHGLWDYDIPCAPSLVNIVVDGKPIKAVVQATKHGFAFVFDRVTGKPVWPIEERPVPQSDVPGEVTSPTQPFPTKPAPFTVQGVSEADLIDFTPELLAEAKEILSNYKIGPLFTPPGVDKPLIFKPSMGGGVNWTGVGVDPETGILYVPSMNHPAVSILRKGDPSRTNYRYVRSRARVQGPRGLPLFKPPYGHITAIDLNTGEHLWKVANGGDGPIDHEALKDLDLPPLGTNNRAGPLITKTLLFVADGSGRSGSATGGGNRLRAFDKLTGEALATFELPDHATGVPMTYMSGGKQFIVVAVGSRPAQFVALALP